MTEQRKKEIAKRYANAFYMDEDSEMSFSDVIRLAITEALEEQKIKWDKDLSSLKWHSEKLQEVIKKIDSLEEQKREYDEKIQKCYTECWKTLMYPISLKGKPKADDIIKREFPFVIC